MIRVATLTFVSQIVFLTCAGAQEAPTPLENAPCNWFAKARGDSWGTDHVVQINDQQAISGFTFVRGVLKTNSGTDAYDYLQQKCGTN